MPTVTMPTEQTIALDWLKANGVDELLPADQVIVVDPITERIFYRAFVFKNDERCHDVQKIETNHLAARTEDRVVPLVEPLTDEVRAAFADCSAASNEHRAVLVENGRHTLRVRDLPEWARSAFPEARNA